MSKHGKTISIVVGLAFAAFLLWTTLAGQKVECEVCVDYNGERNCAVASHENEAQAIQSAQTTACGPLARGMNDAIACGNRPPVKQACRAN